MNYETTNPRSCNDRTVVARRAGPLPVRDI